MTKIKVKQLTACGNTIYQRTESTGVYNNDVFTAAQVESNPSKFEIVESNATAESILRASFPEGWVRVKEVRGMKPRTGFREAQLDSAQQINAVKHNLKAARFSPVDGKNEMAWERVEPDGSKVRVTIYDDGHWNCAVGGKMHDDGKDSTTLDSHLYSAHPVVPSQESARLTEANRRRVERAYRLMGLNVAESKVAADTEETTLLECWARLLGSDEAAQIAMKGGKR